jgi:NAD(P)-dependent dehydrogenase (short-subunit alcohol dehydrogenase family)
VSFHGKTVLITGSTSGIGLATAERFGSLAAHVVVSGRDTTRGEQAVSSINEAGGHARFVQSDLSDPYALLRPAGEAGEVDILVNNAGASTIGSTVEMGLDAVHHVFDVNVIAPFLLTGQLAPKMGVRGGGAIINVSSHAAGHGIPILPAYGATKAGIDLLTKAWAVEFGPVGVRVNAVSPGAVRTPPPVAMGDMFDQMANATPLGRAASADEVAAVIAYLASDDAS